ncbi:MAG: hypothetical protein ACRD2C_09435 [Acidimicrobiales bacterium]
MALFDCRAVAVTRYRYRGTAIPTPLDLGNGVMGPALGTEPVGTRVEDRLEDRLEDQLQAGLHDPVPGSAAADRRPWEGITEVMDTDMAA